MLTENIPVFQITHWHFLCIVLSTKHLQVHCHCIKAFSQLEPMHQMYMTRFISVQRHRYIEV